MRWPLRGFDPSTITQGFSPSHLGNDLPASEGTPVLAPAMGRIDGVGNNRSYVGGLYVTMRGNDGHRYYMGHNSLNRVAVGQFVGEGEHIADVGATGTQVTGPHIHFQIWNPDGNLVDPSETLIEEQENLMNIEQATKLAQRIGLLAGMSEAEITENWLEYQASHILADIEYAAALAAQLYNGPQWQTMAYKGGHYDADVAAAQTGKVASVVVNGVSYAPSK